MDRPPPGVGDSYSYKFGNVQIFKKEELGHGSYGAVYKAKCDALPCAAKLIYPLLFGSNTSLQPDPSQGKEHRQPMRRFEAECRFLSQIKHPNIVQYLGMYRDPETNAPVLLMELMDESLTHFLETARNPILFHIQVNILHDTALALAFLHTNGITHRDLSSNNVLLIAGSRAKVTDFGMSTLTDAAEAPHLASMTQCPGTPAYMPPEALKKPPKYSEKLDCFSFGVLTVQVITREFPDPADQLQAREMFDPHMKKVQGYVEISELERRQSHISLIPATHPLQPISLDCLKDRDVERPTAQQLCSSMERLKTTPLYASSIHQITDRDCLLQTQRQTIQDKEKQLQDKQQTIQDQQQTIQDQQQQLQRVEEEVQQLRRQNEQLQKQQPNQQLESENQQLRRQVQSSEELVAEFQQGMTDKDRQIKQLQTQLQQLQLKSDQQQQQPEVRKKTAASKELKLTWTKSAKAPTVMTRGSSVVIDNVVYVNPWDSRDIYALHYNTMKWSTLPQSPYTHSTLTTINNKLTTIGGAATNKVFTYHDQYQKWVDLYTPMTTVRVWAAVFSTTTHVIVIGGGGSSGWLNTTEILNIETKQWSKGSPLPYETRLATITLCEDTLYVMGGATASDNDYSVLTCQLRDLVEQSTPSTQTQPSSSTTTHPKVWHNIPDLPVRYSTCVTVQGHVLAIGGEDKQGKRSSAIYRYDQQRNQWTVIKNKMTIARSFCLATVLPDNNLLVVGGWKDIRNWTDKTEIAMIV